MKLDEKSAKGAAILIVVIVAVILSVVLFKDLKKVFDKILQSLGLKDSPENTENKGIVDDATRKAAQLGANSAWSPLYYKQKANAKIFTQAKTDGLVKQLWDSVGYFVDSPELFPAAIKQCGYKSQVSWLSKNFSDKHDSDLLTWASLKFDTDEQKYQLAVALKYVDNLPSGLS
jgi:hypothetical protein